MLVFVIVLYKQKINARNNKTAIFTSGDIARILHSTAATFSTQSDMASQLFKKSVSDAPRQTRRVCLRGFRWFANCLYMGMTSAAKVSVQCNSKPHMVRCNAPGLLQIAALVLQAEGTTVEKGIVRKSFQQTCDIRIPIAVPSKVLRPLKSAGNLCW